MPADLFVSLFNRLLERYVLPFVKSEFKTGSSSFIAEMAVSFLNFLFAFVEYFDGILRFVDEVNFYEFLMI